MTNPFDPELWEPVEGFELTDVTYHWARRAPVVRVALDRPEVRNTFRPHTVDEFYRVLDHARMSSDVGCVLLTGGVGALETRLILLPGDLVMGLLGPQVGKLFDRHGPKGLTVFGAAVLAVVMWRSSHLEASTPVWLFVFAFVPRRPVLRPPRPQTRRPR